MEGGVFSWMHYEPETDRLMIVWRYQKDDATVDEWHNERLSMRRSLKTGDVVGVVVQDFRKAMTKTKDKKQGDRELFE